MLKTLFIVKVKAFEKTSKIKNIRKFKFENIKIKITNISQSIIVKYYFFTLIYFIKYINNVKF